jgi:RNA polymerase sigma-70 factor (ECF subfamily)
MHTPGQDAQDLLQDWLTQYGDGMYGYVYTLVGSRVDADDVYQSVFLALIRMGSRIHDIRHPKTYIYRTARHAALRMLVDRQRQPQAMDEILLDPPASADDPPFDVEQLNWALAQLSERDREVVVLRIYDEMAFRDIARVTQSLLPTVAARYVRALRKLRKLLEQI